MKKISTASLLLIVWLIMGLVPAYAENGSSKDKQEREKQEKSEAKELKSQAKLARSLSRGLSGDDVRTIQEWLARDRDVYPEGIVSGYYGALTEKAIKKFQKKHCIEQVGIVGPKTRAQLERIFAKLEQKLTNAGINPSPLEAVFNGMLASSSLATSTGSTGHKLTLCHKGGESISVDIHAIAAHLKHGDTVGACGGTATTTDKTAPVIYGVSAVPGVATATVSWLTNEPANAKVWYATAPDVMASPTRASVSDLSLSTSRTLNLSGLSANTQYYFLAVSTDASGNTATSTSNLYTFMTSPLTLTDVTAVPASTTATVSWQTNVATDSVVHYATSTPVLSASGYATSSSASLVTSHSIGLSNLATSSTYYYFAVSKDVANNTATSSESSFLTAAN